MLKYNIDLNGKTVLLTGAAGFIGAFLSKELMEQSYTVIGIDNLNDYYDVRLKTDRIEMINKYFK